MHNRIVCINDSANSEYWDILWEKELKDQIHTKYKSKTFVTNVTERYLSKGSAILEGGCGLGTHVNSLSLNGFQVTGVDYAQKTVSSLNELMPELDVRLGDVRNLPFENDSFDGYWSLGVIEHFWFGYDGIANEMHRVLRVGGYLFLTFPWISPLRKYKVAKGFYPHLTKNDGEPNSFYQFLLSTESVSQTFINKGFEVVYITGLDGLKGLKDEVEIFSLHLNRLYKSKLFSARICVKLINFALSWYCGHIQLMVLRKV